MGCGSPVGLRRRPRRLPPPERVPASVKAANDTGKPVRLTPGLVKTTVDHLSGGGTFLGNAEERVSRHAKRR